MKNSGYRKNKLNRSFLALYLLYLMVCSTMIFSCNNSIDFIKRIERKEKLNSILSSDNIKYVFSFPVKWAFGDFNFYLVVTRDGRCVVTQGRLMKENIYLHRRQNKEYLFFTSHTSNSKFCGKMLNDSTLEFKTNLLGEIEVSVDYSPDFDRKGIDIDFILKKDNTGNRWSMTCTNWSYCKKDSVYTNYQAVYPMESVVKYFPHKKGHVFIPDSSKEIEAVRIFPGIMGGNFEILLNDIESSSLPVIDDKRKLTSQDINKIIITHNISNRRTIQLKGLITSNGLVILSRHGNPTRLIMSKIYPPNDNDESLVITFEPCVNRRIQFE